MGTNFYLGRGPSEDPMIHRYVEFMKNQSEEADRLKEEYRIQKKLEWEAEGNRTSLQENYSKMLCEEGNYIEKFEMKQQDTILAVRRIIFEQEYAYRFNKPFDVVDSVRHLLAKEEILYRQLKFKNFLQEYKNWHSNTVEEREMYKNDIIKDVKNLRKMRTPKNLKKEIALYKEELELEDKTRKIEAWLAWSSFVEFVFEKLRPRKYDKGVKEKDEEAIYNNFKEDYDMLETFDQLTLERIESEKGLNHVFYYNQLKELISEDESLVGDRNDMAKRKNEKVSLQIRLAAYSTQILTAGYVYCLLMYV